MQKITLFYLPNCPHCKRARALQNELLKDPRYAGLEIEEVDESVEVARAEAHDYYFVPTYYVGEEKAHEGFFEDEDIKAVFEKALQG